MKRLTIKLIDEIYNATGVNIVLLTSDEWRKANPKAQRMLIQAYLRETKQMDGSDGIHLPDDYANLLAEAINYFFDSIPESGKEKKLSS